MKTKMIEIRDRATCIPALAIKMEAANPIENVFLWRCGYPPNGNTIVLMRLSDQRATSDPFGWGDTRTMQAAHNWIIEQWDNIQEGQVIDVRVLFGEESTPAEPEIWTKGGTGLFDKELYTAPEPGEGERVEHPDDLAPAWLLDLITDALIEHTYHSKSDGAEMIAHLVWQGFCKKRKEQRTSNPNLGGV